MDEGTHTGRRGRGKEEQGSTLEMARWPRMDFLKLPGPPECTKQLPGGASENNALKIKTLTT